LFRGWLILVFAGARMPGGKSQISGLTLKHTPIIVLLAVIGRGFRINWICMRLGGWFERKLHRAIDGHHTTFG